MRAHSTADLFRAILQGQSGDDIPRLPLGVVGCDAHPWRGVADSGTDPDGRRFAHCTECRDKRQAETRR